MKAPTVGLGVAAKAPVPGLCKTRLTPPLTAEQATALYSALLGDTAEAVEGQPARRYLLAAPEHDGVNVLLRMFPSWRTVAQVGHDLGARMDAAVRMMLADGCDVAVVLGSDAPLVPLADVMAAAPWLAEEKRRVLVGPSEDGGYWCIAAAQPVPQLFRDIPWSTDSVMALTRQRAREAGITLRELALSDDVDDEASLRRFMDRVSAGAQASRCARLFADPPFRGWRDG